MTFFKTLLAIGAFLLATQAFAQSSGGNSIGFGVGILSAPQTDLNSYLDGLNIAGVKDVGSAYEFSAQYAHRFSGTMFAVIFRPSLFTQSSTGTASANMSGVLFFPIVRLVPLENNFMKFFLQVGVGYGNISGTLSNGSSNLAFSGGTFGGLAGLGAEFCFTPSNCIVLEGNARYLPIYRNIVTASSGNMGGSIGTPVLNGELRANNNDVITTMGGFLGIVGYNFYF